MSKHETRSGEKRQFPNNPSCPVRDVLTPLTSKWSMLVLFALMEGPERFSSLKRRIEGISQRMLTVTVRQLQREGYILRIAYPEVPPRVEYQLTSLGDEVVKPLCNLILWSEKRHEDIRSARTVFDSQEVAPIKKGF